MNATIKLLLIVREPVTRAISDYTQLRSHAATAALPQPSIVSKYVQTEAVIVCITYWNSTITMWKIYSNCRSFEELAVLPNGTVNESYRPLAISMYHLHLHRWLEVFPREQLMIVNGDQLIDDPLSQLKRIETFLGKL